MEIVRIKEYKLPVKCYSDFIEPMGKWYYVINAWNQRSGLHYLYCRMSAAFYLISDGIYKFNSAAIFFLIKKCSIN